MFLKASVSVTGEYSFEWHWTTTMNGDNHFLDYFQKQTFGKIPHWNLIMKLTTLIRHKDMLLNQVIPYLSFAIQ